MVRRLVPCLLLIAGCSCDEVAGVDAGAAAPETPIDVEEVLARHHVEWPAAEREQAITEGRAAIVRHQCNRCHTIDDIEPAARPTHCVSCHEWLKGLPREHRTWTKLASRYGAPIIERYQRNIEHFQRVPDLTHVARRLRPDWIREYIRDPHDLRPMMEEGMIRTRLDEADTRAIVRYFAAVAEVQDPYAPDAPEPPRPGRPNGSQVALGERLFRERGCVTCHTFGNLDTGKSIEDLRALGLASRLAPNLRFARDRIHPDVVAAWISEPQAFEPDTLMPDMNLPASEASAIAEFLLHGDPQVRPAPPPPVVEMPPAATHQVSWAEVKERVLGRICVHCHMNDHEQDPGPGNNGGYGWPGSHFRMRTYETLVSGARGPDGERYSVLVPREGETFAPILTAMLRRRLEHPRDVVLPFEDHERPAHPEQPPGMPMGLPTMTDEEIGLVRAWIEQGCPGPTEVTGMPGIYDGFLTPDGPIPRNRGCELRPPAEPRPEWANQPPPPWHEGPRQDPPPAPAPAPDSQGG
jgi:hypothetical protein